LRASDGACERFPAADDPDGMVSDHDVVDDRAQIVAERGGFSAAERAYHQVGESVALGRIQGHDTRIRLNGTVAGGLRRISFTPEVGSPLRELRIVQVKNPCSDRIAEPTKYLGLARDLALQSDQPSVDHSAARLTTLGERREEIGEAVGFGIPARSAALT
jgi:hypothetical protein